MMKQIEIMVNDKIGQIPKPELITITKIHTDNHHVDAQTENQETLTYIPVIGTPTINQKGVLLHLENNKQIIITSGGD